MMRIVLIGQVTFGEAVLKALNEKGKITSITDHGFVVSAVNGAILIKRIQPDGSPKIPTPEFVNQTGLKAGDRLD